MIPARDRIEWRDAPGLSVGKTDANADVREAHLKV